jgi:hypothetical protein
MLSGALIKIPDDFDIQRLNGTIWSRLSGELTLQSVIQFSEGTIVMDRETRAQAALAIHQDIRIEPTLIQESDGRYSIIHHDVVKTAWSNIYAAQGYIVVDRLENRSFVRQIINRGLSSGSGLGITAHDVYLDTARIVANHPDQWIRGFSGRMGRVDRGTVFGEGVERDSVFGPELNRSMKKSVGWVTNFFGSPTKVKISPSGSVTVWANPTEGLFLSFLRIEILPYIIALP